MMKRKRLLLSLGCMASMLLAGYGTLWLTGPGHRINWGNIQAIQKGMTEKEVEGILGVPAGVYASGAKGYYVPVPWPGTIWLDRSAGGKEWVGENCSACITFDGNGRVDEIYMAMTINESFLPKLRRWLGR